MMFSKTRYKIYKFVMRENLNRNQTAFLNRFFKRDEQPEVLFAFATESLFEQCHGFFCIWSYLRVGRVSAAQARVSAAQEYPPRRLPPAVGQRVNDFQEHLFKIYNVDMRLGMN